MLRALLLPFTLLVSVRAELVATFTQDGRSDARMDRIAALSVPPGESPTPFLSVGKFDVVWAGNMELMERRRLYFSFGGVGKASLSIGGETVLTEEGALGAAKTERLRLAPGRHKLSVSYSSKADGEGEFRLYWEEEEMQRQTIPPTVFTAEASDEAILGELKRHGRIVFTRHHCAKCHASENGFAATPMPETGEIAPILVGIGKRVTEKWLRQWLADPKALKPGTNMPNLIDATTPEGLQQAADLAAFLAEPKLGEGAFSVPDPALSEGGGILFHELGCIVCHDQAASDPSHVPLHNVASKYRPGQLISFLKKPEAFHPFTAMPNFKLTDDEAKSLAEYLTVSSEGKGVELGHEFPDGDDTRGAELAVSLHCGACHPGLPGGKPNAPGLAEIFKVEWETVGCVAEDDGRRELPLLNFGAKDREGLLAFSKGGMDSLKKDSSAEFAERQIEAKRCTACHAMDNQSPLRNTLHNTTPDFTAHQRGGGKQFDQTRPQLTFVGEMLYTSYIEKMLAGAAEPSPRPWLAMRMPAFAAYATPMAEGLSRMHGFAPSAPAEIKVDPALAEIGKILVGAEGFGCTTCHGIGKQEPTAAFEVGAINFELVPERLREGYYYRWIDNPQSVTPGTKMPRYAVGNKSPREDILDGDACKQYDAIWHWLHSR